MREFETKKREPSFKKNRAPYSGFVNGPPPSLRKHASPSQKSQREGREGPRLSLPCTHAYTQPGLLLLPLLHLDGADYGERSERFVTSLTHLVIPSVAPPLPPSDIVPARASQQSHESERYAPRFSVVFLDSRWFANLCAFPPFSCRHQSPSLQHHHRPSFSNKRV